MPQNTKNAKDELEKQLNALTDNDLPEEDIARVANRSDPYPQDFGSEQYCWVYLEPNDDGEYEFRLGDVVSMESGMNRRGPSPTHSIGKIDCMNTPIERVVDQLNEVIWKKQSGVKSALEDLS